MAEIQAKLDQYDQEDGESRVKLQSLRNWSEYRDSAGPERIELVQRMRSTLKDYREAMIFESTLAKIPAPDPKRLKAFRINYFHGHPGDRDSFPTLGGDSSGLFDDAHDLVTLQTVEQPDRLTMFVQDNFGYLFTELPTRGQSGVPCVENASGRKIASFVAYLSTTLAALLMIGAILVLYNVKSDNLKLVLIGLFTAAFAASVGLLTNAKRAEVFGSTAAYAAVLVVFVSGNLGA